MLREEVKPEEVKPEERGFFPLSHSSTLALSHSSPLPTQNSKLTHGQVFDRTKSPIPIEEFGVA